MPKWTGLPQEERRKSQAEAVEVARDVSSSSRRGRPCGWSVTQFSGIGRWEG